MIKIKLSCRYDDKYSVVINKKKVRLNKESSNIYQYFDYTAILTNELLYKIVIKRKLLVTFANCLFNIFNAIGLGDRKNYSKITNCIKITILNDVSISDGNIHVIINIKDDIVVNDVMVSGSIKLQK